MPIDIPDLIKQFTKKPGCARYSHDSEKLALLADYVWLWQLTPSLPFETFLEKYAAVADHDDTNLKHPDTAMRALCPRTQASAARLNRPQWTAAQLADFAMLYIDMIRAADEAQMAVPLPFSTFLKNLGPKYLDGTFPPKPTPLFDNVVETPPASVAPTPPPAVAPPLAAPPVGAPAGAAPPAARTRARKSAMPAATPVVSTLTIGQPVVYTNMQGRQRIGVAEAIETDPQTQRTYVTFIDNEGERFDGLSIESVRPATPADGPLPAPTAGPRVASVRLTIPRATYPSVAATLSLKTPNGTVPVGHVIYPFEVAFDPAVAPGFVAHLDVVNGETGPYVDAYLNDANGTAVAEVPPRENIIGTYSFKTAQGVFEMVVASRGIDEGTLVTPSGLSQQSPAA